MFEGHHKYMWCAYFTAWSLLRIIALFYKPFLRLHTLYCVSFNNYMYLFQKAYAFYGYFRMLCNSFLKLKSPYR